MSLISIVTEQQQKGVYIAQFKTNHLAVFTYYVESAGQSYLIDPTYDYIIYQDFIQKRGSKIKYVVLTHYHADFVAGHTQFNVPVIMGPNSKGVDKIKFQLIEFKEDEKFKVGKVETRVISTPGHTLESACYILANEEGKEFCIFSGDTIFLKEVGRPDLAVASSLTKEDLAAMLYDSVQKVKALDPNLRLYPAHGSGSACGKAIGAGNFCDLKTQGQKNYAFLINSKEEFVKTLTLNIPNPPKYFFHDANLNKTGQLDMFEDSLKKINIGRSQQEFQKYIAEGIAVIDTRQEISNGIIKGAYWISSKAPLCQLIAHVIEPTQQFAIITEKGKQQETMQRFLRVGYFNILGFNNFDVSEWKGQTYAPSIKTIEEVQKEEKWVHIDVRNKPEWHETGTFENSLTVPLPQLKSRVHQAKQFSEKHKGSTIVVNCKLGMRARLASSILLKHGIQNIVVLNENLEKIGEKGVKLHPYKQ